MALAAISSMMGQMPGQNKQVATGLQEAAKTQLQAGFGAQGPMEGPLGVRQKQQIAAQAAAAQGQAAVTAQQQATEKAGQVGQMAAQQQAAEAQQRLQSRQIGIQRQQRNLDASLKSFSADLHKELIDNQMQFHKDELGRALFNERQLLDYKLATAKSQIEIQETERNMRQMSQKRVMLLDAAKRSLFEELNQEMTKSEREKDQASIVRMQQAQQALEKKLQKEARDRATRAAMFAAAGAVLVTVGTMGIGAALSTAFGAKVYAVGASAGMAAGQAAAIGR